VIVCRKCGSPDVHAEKRGWTATTGFIGSSKIVVTSLACGHRTTPGARETAPGTKLLAMVLIGAFVIWLLVSVSS
jgi:hypothetical protein